MEVSVSGRNVELSPALRAAVERKVGSLGRYLRGVSTATVHFVEERNRRIAARDVVEVTLEGGGHHLRAKVAAGDPLAAVDAATAKLEHQLRRVKTKLVSRSHPRRAARPVPATEDEATTDEE